jgi:hypothetical protein
MIAVEFELLLFNSKFILNVATGSLLYASHFLQVTRLSRIRVDIEAELEELTAEAEDEGFTQSEDLGWRGDDHRQFMRILTHGQKRVQATIHYVESEEAEFFYVTVSSRTQSGEVWNTWNYPFLLSLKPAPNWRFQSVSGNFGLLEIIDSHERWLSKNGVTNPVEIPSDPEAVQMLVEQDAAALVSHNLKCGVLAPADEGKVRYTLRGCLFLWSQFIRDLIGAR